MHENQQADHKDLLEQLEQIINQAADAPEAAIYKRMYLSLFNSVTGALNYLDQQKYGLARDTLVSGQQRAGLLARFSCIANPWDRPFPAATPSPPSVPDGQRFPCGRRADNFQNEALFSRRFLLSGGTDQTAVIARSAATWRSNVIRCCKLFRLGKTGKKDRHVAALLAMTVGILSAFVETADVRKGARKNTVRDFRTVFLEKKLTSAPS